MTWFTDSPFERMMVQRPRAGKSKTELRLEKCKLERKPQEQPSAQKKLPKAN